VASSEQKNMAFADLHIHSVFSDGKFSPEKLAEMAYKAGLKGIAVTDHDTVAGIKKARLRGTELGVEIISGVELSCEIDGCEIHILGYFAPGREDELEQKLEWYQQKREERVYEILDKLKQNGVNLEIEHVQYFSNGKSVGRLHVAKALIEQRKVYSIHEAFSRYLGPNGVAYVPKTKLTIREAVDLIHEHQGVAVLAHPGMYQIKDVVERTLDDIDGIEVWYPEHSQRFEDELHAIALRNRLIPTGGSDFHGVGNKVYIGCVRVPYSIVTRLLEVAVGV